MSLEGSLLPKVPWIHLYILTGGKGGRGPWPLWLPVELESSLKTTTGVLKAELQSAQLGTSWREMGLESPRLSCNFGSTPDPLRGLGQLVFPPRTCFSISKFGLILSLPISDHLIYPSLGK